MGVDGQTGPPRGRGKEEEPRGREGQPAAWEERGECGLWDVHTVEHLRKELVADRAAGQREFK